MNKEDEDPDEIIELKKVVKEKLRDLLVKFSEQTKIAFPRFEVEVHPKEVIAHLTFIDIISPLAYFKKPEKELRNKEEPEKSITAASEMECASLALKDKEVFGYEYCKGGKNPGVYCDHLNENMIASNKTDATHCVIREKIAEVSKVTYLTIQEKIQKIKTAAEKKDLKLSHQGQELSFEQLHIIADESEIDRSKLFHRVRKGEKILDEHSTNLKIDDGITNLQSCFEACVDPKNNHPCDTFSFCKKFGVLYDCNLAELNRKAIPTDGWFEKSDECHVYLVSALLNYQEHPEKKLLDKDDEGGHLRTFDAETSAECAQDCLNFNQEKNGKQCLSIEICEKANNDGPVCRLSSKNTLWKGDSELIEQEGCNVYSVRHLMNYQVIAKEKLNDFHIESVTSVDQCASACDGVGDCDRFNYCERDGDFNECRFMSEKVAGDTQNTKLDSDELNCVSWIRRDKFIELPNLGTSEELFEKQVEKRPSGKGFGRGSVTGFVFLFLFIGMFVGVGGLYAKNRYLNRGGSDGGENATITFSNLNRENDD